MLMIEIRCNPNRPSILTSYPVNIRSSVVTSHRTDVVIKERIDRQKRTPEAFAQLHASDH